MKSTKVLAVSALLLVALFLTTPQSTEAALLDDFLITADKATSFFQGAYALDTAAEAAAEAAEPKAPGEVEREAAEAAAKTPDEVADEALEAARDAEL